MRRASRSGSRSLDRQPTPMSPRLKRWISLICVVLAAASASSRISGAAAQPAAPEGKVAAPPPATAPGAEEPPIAPGALEFHASVLSPRPAAGKGRLSLVMEGNRRWCTYRDDRVNKPPDMRNPRVGVPPPSRDDIYTFGYQFTIAAVRRSNPGETLMLYE